MQQRGRTRANTRIQARIRGKRGNGEGRGNKKPFKTFKVSHENGRSESRQALTTGFDMENSRWLYFAIFPLPSISIWEKITA